MATLKNADFRTIKDAFVRDGYVLDFRNKTFSEFFEDEFAVDIYADKYGSSKDSKGKRLRAFAEVESPHLVARMLRALWIYSEEVAFEGRGTDAEGPGDQRLKRKVFELVDRLEGDAPPLSVAKSFEPTGEREDYSLDPKPIGGGAAASVFAATHKLSGERVAFKKLIHAHSEDARARMLREIEVCRALADNRGVVDLLDADPAGTWYVMRLADGDLNDFRVGLTAERVVDVFQQIAEGLREAHERGFLHRDLKPANILRFGERWVVADWGLVRRPRGESTSDRTKLGSFYGTEGFSAPEAWHDAHRMTEASDVYALGQILGWMPEGSRPIPNVPPARAGRWTAPASSATQLDPQHRPTLDEFVEAVVRAGAPPPAGELVDRMVSSATRRGGPQGINAAEALELAGRVPDERMLYDVLPRLPADALRAAIRSDPALASEVVREYDPSRKLNWGSRSFDYLNDVVETVVEFAEEAVAIGDAVLLNAATSVLLELDERWDRYRAREAIRAWLATLSGYSAKVVAKALRGRPEPQRRELASRMPGQPDAAILEALG